MLRLITVTGLPGCGLAASADPAASGTTTMLTVATTANMRARKDFMFPSGGKSSALILPRTGVRRADQWRLLGTEREAALRDPARPVLVVVERERIDDELALERAQLVVRPVE